MRLLICGGRDYDDFERVHLVLKGMPVPITTIIEGGASGADHCAAMFARAADIPLETYKADWKTYGRYAGPLRNTRMLTEGKPDMVIAFPGGKGTANMIMQAKQRGVHVIVAPAEPLT